MATKTPGKKPKGKASKDSGAKRTVARTSRKTIRKTAAPLARKADDGDDDDAPDKPKRSARREPPDAPAAKGDDDKKPAIKADDRKSAPADRPGPAPVKPAPAPVKPAPAPAAKSPPAPADKPAPVSAAKPAPAPAARPAPAPAPPPAPPESEFAELLPPQAIQDWDPDSAAPPPGKAPPGDSRSFRRFHEGAEEFVLIYRHQSFLITRSGKVGTQGTWSIVEYPHVGLAANAYAHKCSDLTGAGYRDLR